MSAGRTIPKIVPWGRSMDEYVRMFALADSDRASSILGCGDGPASFNAEWRAVGGRVVSVDPVYQYSADAIASRIDEARDLIVANTLTNMDAYVWDEMESVDRLVDIRTNAMSRFLEDHRTGGKPYVAAQLPDLPFADKQFDLALCSHFLFTYTALISTDQHIGFLKEALRVAQEVRVFPILDMDGGPSPHVDPVRTALTDLGFTVGIERVPYEYQKGGNQMLRASSIPPV
jgi:SAM-dependent methyltransferase